MSLHEMMRSGLPMNRKERYFTGTVFPMIVCADGFRHLDILSRLIGGRQLPAVESDPARANIQFFTEYSLVESIYDQQTKKRFPHPPATKDTPDIVILVRGAKTVLIALEAKMYHQPQLNSLQKQLKAQREQLNYLAQHLTVDEVWHAALLPKGFMPELGKTVPSGSDQPGFAIVRWEDLLASYRTIRPSGDYFIGVLDLALRDWQSLCSQPLAYGVNAERVMKGGVIVRLFGKDPSLSVMGRSGGILGPALAEDISSGNWRNQGYEVSAAAEPPNKNWFYVSDFVELTKNRPAASIHATTHLTVPPAVKQTSGGYAKRTGADIIAHAGDPTVKIVGRQGGLNGALFAEDLATGRWRTWPYAISAEAVPLNKNWFAVDEFLGRVHGD